MSNNNEPIGYDEDDAVKFIKNYLPQELKDKFSDNDINYVIDVIYDFYDEKGFMNENASDEDIVELDEDELIDYVYKNSLKDKVTDFTRDEIGFIVEGELQYCESMGMFD